MSAVVKPTAGHLQPAEPSSPPRRTEVGRRRRQRRLVFFSALAFGVVLIAGTGLRLWHLGISPAWQWDEAVYYRVSVNVQHGVLSEHPVYGVPWEPFLYQPPFYFLVLSRWFSIVGASIYHARLLGVILTAAMQAVLFRLLWKIHGPAVALFAIVPVIFDGWLMYIERVSYIENALMLIVVTGLLLYQRALEQPSWQRFAIAGAAIGFAASFKQTATYVLLAVLLCWLVLRRAHKGHLVLLGVAMAVIVAYVAVMVPVFDVPDHDWYIGQSITQVRRVLALQQSGGTLTSPGGVLHLLAAQYRFFVPSVLVALAAFATGHAPYSAVLPSPQLGAGSGECAAIQLASDRDRRLRCQLLEVPAILRLDPYPGVLLLLDGAGPLELALGLEEHSDGRGRSGRDGLVPADGSCFQRQHACPGSAVRGDAYPCERHRGYRGELRRPDPATVVHGRSRDSVPGPGHVRDHLAHVSVLEFQRGRRSIPRTYDGRGSRQVVQRRGRDRDRMETEAGIVRRWVRVLLAAALVVPRLW